LVNSGVFVDNVVARGKDVVQKIIDKNIRTLSPGIDPATESFIEISATPVPAIIGLVCIVKMEKCLIM
jgi:hypothetical protein